MSDENTLEITSPEVQPNPELDQLKQSVEALERKNHELIGKLKKAKTVPEGVNVQELIDFRNKAEQKEFESQGKYTEARQALEQQFREEIAVKDKRIAELEARVRELELITPAVSALADVVHDPDLILKTKLSSDQIAREADGTVVVVDGYQRTPVGEWAKSLPSWMQKQPKPQGSGAPSGRSSGDIPTGISNPFAPDNFNLTEQSRLYRTDRDLYDRLKAAAKR
jgi:hypothetical protein